MDKVAVVTPCFNAKKWIEECVESVAKSVTFGKFEIEHWLVDDASTDGTVELIKSLTGVKKIFLSNNIGPSGARNKGVEATEADYVFFLDADDIIFQNSLNTFYDACIHDKYNWVFCDFLRVNQSREYLVGQDYYGWAFSSSQKLLLDLFSGAHFVEQNSFFKMRLIKEAGGFDASMRIGEDFDLWVRLAIRGYFPIHVPGAMYAHRFHDLNLTRDYRNGKAKHIENVANAFKKYEASLFSVLSRPQIQELERRLTEYL